MKSYPLDVEDNRNDYYQSVMSRGHHDFDAFMAQAKERFEWADKMLTPEHIWYKAVPFWDGYGTCIRHVDVPKGTRGAFPVTFAAECETQHAYQAVE